MYDAQFWLGTAAVGFGLSAILAPTTAMTMVAAALMVICLLADGVLALVIRHRFRSR